MSWKVVGSVKRDRTCVYLWLIHVDVWKKPTQYCKAVIFQLKIILKTSFKKYMRWFIQFSVHRPVLLTWTYKQVYYIRNQNINEITKEHLQVTCRISSKLHSAVVRL